MFAILGWIAFGLIVGIIAKFLMPGKDPGGIIVTMLLGIVGALFGGFVGRSLGMYGANQGAGFLMSVAYLIPGQVGWGRFQPHIRYQGFDESETNAVKNPTANNQARFDIGVNYVMVGHNARISLVYSHTAVTGSEEFGMWTLGSQFQF
jgi:uncharacterized membrane protein YeaQ/YmgE (transglycosylase-associated protein family)